jgi:hypothetical protein
MNFLLATVAYLFIGLVLGVGIVMAARGNAWLLVFGGLAYVVAFATMGCLPAKHH